MRWWWWIGVLGRSSLSVKTTTQMRVELRPTTPSELSHIVDLERASYPEDEAATAASLDYRLREAGEYFRTVVVDDAVGGFICGTRCVSMTADAMTTHAAGAPVLAIHSVVVAPEKRRRGVATKALALYVEEMQRSSARSIRLIAKAALLPLYRGAGFEVLGLSPIVHGADPWFECAYDLRRLDMVQVDAFTDRVFGGNPAAVVFAMRDDDWMAKLAIENNLSETVYLERSTGNTFRIRWFTPGGEVDLCGHATLGAAKALHATGRADFPMTFETRNVGTLTVDRRVADGREWLAMDFPTADLVEADPPAGLEKALNADALLFVGRGPDSVPDWFVEVSPRVFAALDVDVAALAAEPDVVRGVIVTARGDDGVDFKSRFFAPRMGIPEDPVTGSAHTLLAKYWETKLQREGPLLAHQTSKRGGVLRVETTPNGRTIIQGQAALVFHAKLCLDDDDDV